MKNKSLKANFRTTAALGAALLVTGCGAHTTHYQPYSPPGSDYYPQSAPRVIEPQPQNIQQIGCHWGHQEYRWPDGSLRGTSGANALQRAIGRSDAQGNTWLMVSPQGQTIGACPDPDRGFDSVQTSRECVYYRPGTTDIYKKRQCGSPIYSRYGIAH